MRVIAGKWRGRKLRVSGAVSLRPTADRTKSAMFSILGGLVAEHEVLDLCCGAGGLGMEALSRGAARVDFVDTSRGALACVRKNLALCEATAESFGLHRADARSWLRRYLDRGEWKPFLIVADPPYDSQLGVRLLEIVTQVPAEVPLLAAVLELRRGTTVEWPPGSRFKWRERRYGEATLVIVEA